MDEDPPPLARTPAPTTRTPCFICHQEYLGDSGVLRHLNLAHTQIEIPFPELESAHFANAMHVGMLSNNHAGGLNIRANLDMETMCVVWRAFCTRGGP